MATLRMSLPYTTSQHRELETGRGRMPLFRNETILPLKRDSYPFLASGQLEALITAGGLKCISKE